MKKTFLGVVVLLFIVSAFAVAQQKPPAGGTVSVTDAANKVSAGWVLLKGAANVFVINDGATEVTVTYSVADTNEAPVKVAAGKTVNVPYKGKGYANGKGVIKVVKVESAAAAADAKKTTTPAAADTKKATPAADAKKATPAADTKKTPAATTKKK
ncbi:MAG: hypothetical protein LBP76_07805 [Treponema sp.]|jgi:hypothetical protein|nr:hypothetical protein [Treponema sp.]